MNAYTKLTRELIAVPRVRIEIGIPEDMTGDDIADLSVETCREVREALKAMIDRKTETYTSETRDGEAQESAYPEPCEEPTIEFMVTDMLSDQMRRLDAIACDILAQTDARQMTTTVDAMHSITASMCAIARGLRG